MGKKNNTTIVFGTCIKSKYNEIPKYRRDEKDEEREKQESSRTSRTRRGGRKERQKQNSLHERNADTMHCAHFRHQEAVYLNGFHSHLRQQEKNAFSLHEEEEEPIVCDMGISSPKVEWVVGYYWHNEADQWWTHRPHLKKYVGTAAEVMEEVDAMNANSLYFTAWIENVNEHKDLIYILYEEDGVLIRVYDNGEVLPASEEDYKTAYKWDDREWTDNQYKPLRTRIDTEFEFRFIVRRK